jgi:GntR family transcriptional regulator
MLTVDPRDPLPLWRQLEEGVRNLVAAGALAPGAAVPSVRELARELAVNPATIAKAYQRLCDAGVLEVRRGEGTFVAAGTPTLPRAERRRRLAPAARSYAAHAATLGLGVEEAVTAVRQACEELEEERGDGDGNGEGGRGERARR